MQLSFPNNIIGVPQSLISALCNSENWKKTRVKQYDAYVGMPDIGVEFTNFITGNRYVISESQRFVISDIMGALESIDGSSLAQNYTWVDGTMINKVSWLRRLSGEETLNWTKVTAKTSAECFAFIIPLRVTGVTVYDYTHKQVIANKAGIEHGLGDVLVAPSVNGVPDVRYLKLVNGFAFPSMYDLHSFQSIYSDIRYTASDEPVKPNVVIKQTRTNCGSGVVQHVTRLTPPVSGTVVTKVMDSTKKLRACLGLADGCSCRNVRKQVGNGMKVSRIFPYGAFEICVDATQTQEGIGNITVRIRSTDRIILEFFPCDIGDETDMAPSAKVIQSVCGATNDVKQALRNAYDLVKNTGATVFIDGVTPAEFARKYALS